MNTAIDIQDPCVRTLVEQFNTLLANADGQLKGFNPYRLLIAVNRAEAVIRRGDIHLTFLHERIEALVAAKEHLDGMFPSNFFRMDDVAEAASFPEENDADLLSLVDIVIRSGDGQDALVLYQSITARLQAIYLKHQDLTTKARGIPVLHNLRADLTALLAPKRAA